MSYVYDRGSQLEQLSLTKLPTNATIISFTTIPAQHIILTIQHNNKFYLYIYGSNNNSHLDTLVNDVQIIRLSFAPFVLTQTTLFQNNGSADIVLSGGDHSIHIYRKKDSADNSFSELPFDSSHPLQSYHNTSTSAVWKEMVTAINGTRLIVAGYQDGQIRLCSLLVNLENITILSTYNYYLDGPISCIKLYSPSTTVNTVSYEFPIVQPSLPNDCKLSALQQRAITALQTTDSLEFLNESEICMCVGTAIGLVMCYRNLSLSSLTFSSTQYFSGSSTHNSILSLSTLDLNFDSRVEILVGTFSGMMLVYNEIEIGGEYQLMIQKQFAQPIYVSKS